MGSAMMATLDLKLTLDGTGDFKLRVNTRLPARGITAIYGPSGSGKTTLLECIAGLRSADKGSLVSFRGEDWQNHSTTLPPWQRDIGLVFQDGRLFPHLSVIQNLEYAINRQRAPGTIELDQIITWFDLGELLSHSTQTLSAGQQQRVAMARALLSAPKLLILDEPMANLDKTARQQCIDCLLRLKDSIDLPMLYVSHDMEEVSQLADHLVLIKDGEIEAEGDALQLCSRLDTRLSHEEQAATILVATVKQHDHAFGLSELDSEGHCIYVNQLNSSVGSECRLRIPARDISLSRERALDSSILNILSVQIEEIEATHSNRVLLKLSLGQQFLLARITRKSVVDLNLKVGDQLFAQIKSVALLTQSSENDA
jgi:molybdate transport system ATP-binding protein